MLKKIAIYLILKRQYGAIVPKIKKCHYLFNNGYECIEFKYNETNDKTYLINITSRSYGAFITANKYVYDYSKNKYLKIEEIIIKEKNNA